MCFTVTGFKHHEGQLKDYGRSARSGHRTKKLSQQSGAGCAMTQWLRASLHGKALSRTGAVMVAGGSDPR